MHPRDHACSGGYHRVDRDEQRRSGLILEHFSWRFMFVFVLPIAVAAFAIGVVGNSRSKRIASCMRSPRKRAMWPPAIAVGCRPAIASTVATNRAGSVIATHGLTIWAKNVRLSRQSS